MAPRTFGRAPEWRSVFACQILWQCTVVLIVLFHGRKVAQRKGILPSVPPQKVRVDHWVLDSPFSSYGERKKFSGITVIMTSLFVAQVWSRNNRTDWPNLCAPSNTVNRATRTDRREESLHNRYQLTRGSEVSCVRGRIA